MTATRTHRARWAFFAYIGIAVVAISTQIKLIKNTPIPIKGIKMIHLSIFLETFLENHTNNSLNNSNLKINHLKRGLWVLDLV